MRREDALAFRDHRVPAHRVEAEAPPRGLRAFHDERRGVGVELVGMRPYPAVLGALEHEGECLVELGARAEPHELAGARVDLGAERRFVARAGARVDPVGRHEQVAVAADRLDVVHLGLEAQVDAELARAVLQQQEHRPPPQPAEAVAGGDRVDAVLHHADVVPVGEAVADRGGRGRVVGGEVVERLVRQHHAPAEGVVGAVALDHHDLRVGLPELERDREVEPGRAASEADGLHGRSSASRTPPTVAAGPAWFKEKL